MNWTYKIQMIDGIRYFKIEGTDNGSANPHGFKIIRETEHFILCRKSGGMGWFSIGTQVYYKPSYYIYKKSEERIVEQLFGVWEKEYTRETAKETKNEALQKIRDLENQK